MRKVGETVSLISKNLEPFYMMILTRTDDRRGGRAVTWTEGTVVMACATVAMTAKEAPRDKTTQNAQKPDTKTNYTLFTERTVCLPFHCVLKRASDGRVFRIVSDSADIQAPRGARLNLRMHAAEEWRLP